MPCKFCQSDKLEINEKEGNKICIDCGAVQEENAIVSELNFCDNAIGGTSLVGTMIGLNQTGANVRTSTGTHYQNSTEEVTVYRFRHIARGFATYLNLTEYHIEASLRLFRLGLLHNFSKGRRAEVTVAVCLYASCRMEKTSHMLIDFSDLAEASVFKLGSAFVKLIRLLHLEVKVDLVDPSLYISRFVAQLRFGDKVPAVTETALRLVTRMNRDWMVTGRRPAGICGACILIAARIHHFHRTIDQIVRVVRVSAETIRRRLIEFANTESGKMTVGDFNKIMIERGEDPPSFKKARLAEDYSTKMLSNYSDKPHGLSLSSETIKAQITQPIEFSNQDYPSWKDNNEEANLSDLDSDIELNAMFLNEEEIQVKTERWTEDNWDYLEAQRAKLEREAEQEKLAKQNNVVKTPIKRKPKKLPKIDAKTPLEATQQMISQLPRTTKINHDSLASLFIDPDLLYGDVKVEKKEEVKDEK